MSTPDEFKEASSLLFTDWYSKLSMDTHIEAQCGYELIDIIASTLREQRRLGREEGMEDIRKAIGKAIDKFWKLVQKSDGCWTWLGRKDQRGYGQFHSPPTGKIKAHRMAFLLEVGPIQEGLVICHACDNPSCVKPSHLFKGTQKENIQDAARKGRLPDKKGKPIHRPLRTHCLKGHLLEGDNVKQDKKSRGRGCRTCHREYGKRTRDARRALPAGDPK